MTGETQKKICRSYVDTHLWKHCRHVDYIWIYDWKRLKASQQLRIFMGWDCQPHAWPPNLEDQGMSFCLDHHLWPVCHGRPNQQLHYCRHCSQDHMTMQTPPLHQIKVTCRGIILSKYANLRWPLDFRCPCMKRASSYSQVNTVLWCVDIVRLLMLCMSIGMHPNAVIYVSRAMLIPSVWRSTYKLFTASFGHMCVR